MLGKADGLQRSGDDPKRMSTRELLEAIWASESTYQSQVDHSHDHRRYLSREELETVFSLVQRRAQRCQQQLPRRRRVPAE